MIPTTKMNLVEKAMRLAVTKHAGQIRKGDGLPYIIHPVMVAMKLAQHGFPDEVVAAGLAHDLIEDGGCTAAGLEAELDSTVATIVQAVSNDETFPWEEMKAKYVETVRNGPESAKAVCVADKIHNIESLMIAHAEQGPAIWTKFNRGKDGKVWFESKVLKMLKATWSHSLIDEYEQLLNQEKLLA